MKNETTRVRTDGKRVHQGCTREEAVGQHLARAVRNCREQVVLPCHLIPIHDFHDCRRVEPIHPLTSTCQKIPHKLQLDNRAALRAQVGLHVLRYVRDVLDELVHPVQLNLAVVHHCSLIQPVVHRLAVLAPVWAVRDEPHIELPSHPNPPPSQSPHITTCVSIAEKSSQSDHRYLRSIGINLATLVKQVLGDLFRVDDQNLMAEDLEVQQIA